MLTRTRLCLAAALLCAAADAARLPGTGSGHPSASSDGVRQRRLPRLVLGIASGEGSTVLPSNTNVTNVFRTLQRDLLFIERLTALMFRFSTRAIGWVQRWITRSLGYPPRVMVVELTGVIAADDDVRGGGASLVHGRPELLSADVVCGLESDRSGDKPEARGHGDAVINLARVDRLLTKAFNAHGARCVCLLINSPGGSPAQSSLIYQRLRALRKQHKRVPLLAFVEDAAVSGGYYIACAADEIIADPSSIVGSIGVISRGFGYVKAIKKQGVERRVQTAGASKSGIDPYMPVKRKDMRSQKRLLHEIHTNFIEAVQEGRGSRLDSEKAARLHHRTARGLGGCAGWLGKPGKARLRRMVAEGCGLYDGSVYSGDVGCELGLVDHVGEMRSELQRRYGRFVQIERVEEERLDYSRLLRWLF